MSRSPLECDVVCCVPVCSYGGEHDRHTGYTRYTNKEFADVADARSGGSGSVRSCDSDFLRGGGSGEGVVAVMIVAAVDLGLVLVVVLGSVAVGKEAVLGSVAVRAVVVLGSVAAGVPSSATRGEIGCVSDT